MHNNDQAAWMEVMKINREHILRDMGDGLALRRATRADVDALSEYNARVLSDDGPENPDEGIEVWTRDLIEKHHPTFDVGDFTVVEDTRTGTIVSSLNLISQTWRYGGISGVLFGVGRPELVSTLPEYRNRGLVRAQFEVIHQWSTERGEKMQAITGIPYFYRLFGYEMGLELGGGRTGYKPNVPKLKDDEIEPYQIRPAKEGDLAFISDLYKKACNRSLVCCERDEALWRYELSGKSAKNMDRRVLRVITSLDGQRVGYLAHPHKTWKATLTAFAFEVKAGVSWGAVTPSVVRYLYSTGEGYAAQGGKVEEFSAFGFRLGSQHPVYKTMHDNLPLVKKPYAWYVRVPDLPDFLRHIQPVLERRLENSSYASHSGELKITFYNTGLHLVFKEGHFARIDPWKPTPTRDSGEAAFPGLTFLQLLFGYRSFEELDYAIPDCFWKNDFGFGIVNALFPKQASDVWPIS